MAVYLGIYSEFDYTSVMLKCWSWDISQGRGISRKPVSHSNIPMDSVEGIV